MAATEGSTTAKPRLLVLSSTYPRWEGDHEPGFVHELCRRLVDRFDVRVLAPHAQGARTQETMDRVQVTRFRYAPAVLERLVQGGGIPTNLRRHPWKWLLVPAFLLGQAACVRRIAKEWRPHVVHAHWLLPQGLVARCALPSMHASPVVATSHGADLHDRGLRAMRRLRQEAARGATVLTVVSSPMVAKLGDLGVPASKIEVMPMGVDLQSRFTPDRTVRRSPDTLLFVGRLVEKKGLRHLIEAMPCIRSRRPQVTLDVVGSGPEEQPLRALAQQLGVGDAVRFLGPMSNAGLPGILRRAALVVAPFVRAPSGDEEGLGLVLVEAIGCGCPVVVGRVDAVLDVLDPDDPALVDPTDAVALATSVVALLDDPVEALRLADGRLRGIPRFDWSRVAEGYAELLHAQVAGA